jgi:hypothetical protein
VEVDHQRLQAGEERVPLVEVPPASLHEADLGVRERGHDLAQEIARRDEVSVEEGEQLGLRPLEAIGERAGLEARPRARTSTPAARQRAAARATMEGVSSVESSSTWTWSRSRGQSSRAAASIARSAT